MARKPLIWGGVVVVAAAAIAYALTRGAPPDPLRAPSGPERASFPDSPFDLPPIAESPFVNTSLETPFVGSKTCAPCHESAFQSYLATPHSKALAQIDAASEPERVEFDHALTGRRFDVVRRDGRVWHQEKLLADGGEHLLAEFPVKFAIGSGNHTRSFLVEDDGFLLESPITWYAKGRGWWLSPGYDSPQPPGFQRLADIGCIQCHAGRVEKRDGSRFRVRVHDLSIGCESCHGAGGAHVRKRRELVDVAGDAGDAGDADGAGGDLTIVHPARLNRERSEAICAQCHLRGDASVVLRGRQMTDYRPGLRLQDFRADYALQQKDKPMTVVGHVEQMRISRCYSMSPGMTCTTCHDPHGRPAPEARVAHYRDRCLQCHDDCNLERPRRLAQQADDSCIACHMPVGDTDIPHIAFTQHRIGLHGDPAAEPQGVGKLVPLQDLSHLGETEQDRNLALAYHELADKQTDDALFAAYRQRAESLFAKVARDRGGTLDGAAEATLARFAWEQGDLPRAAARAGQALAKGCPSGEAANAHFILGESLLQMQRPREALKSLQAVTELRRQSQDWLLLGLCLRSLGQTDEAAAAFRQALHIDPTRNDIRDALAKLLRAAGNANEADRLERLGQLLLQKKS